MRVAVARTPDAEILAYLRARAQELGRPPRMRECLDGPVYPQIIAQRFGGWAIALRAAGLEPDARQRPRLPDRDDMRRIAAERIRALAQELGRTPRLTDWRGPFGVGFVLGCFGTWNGALQAAGLAPNKRTLRLVRRGISDGEILESLRRLAAELGRRPACTDLTTEAGIRCGCPGAKTITDRFGSLSAALKAAGLDGLPTRHELEARRRAEEAKKLASSGFVLAGEVTDLRQRQILRDAGVPVLLLRRFDGDLGVVLDWLRGRPAKGVLPSREEICAAMGERAFAFLEGLCSGGTLKALGREAGLTRERVRQIIARAARRAVRRLAPGAAEGMRRAPAWLGPLLDERFVLLDEIPASSSAQRGDRARQLRRRGVPVVSSPALRADPSFRAVCDWLRGRPALGALPGENEIRAAMGERPFAVLELLLRGATHKEVAARMNMTCQAVRRAVAQGVKRAAAELVPGGSALLSPACVADIRRALEKAAAAADPQELLAAVEELEAAVHAARCAANSLAVLGARERAAQ